MSLQWTIVATFLYVEIALIVLMLMSIIRPRYWRSFFNSRFMQIVSKQSNLYMLAFIVILVLFFIESIREFHKYSQKLNSNDRMYVGSSAFYEDQMRVFRGQRNFYISGFALLCVFIIKRLIVMFNEMADLKRQLEDLRSGRTTDGSSGGSSGRGNDDDDFGGKTPSAPPAEESPRQRKVK